MPIAIKVSLRIFPINIDAIKAVRGHEGCQGCEECFLGTLRASKRGEGRSGRLISIVHTPAADGNLELHLIAILHATSDTSKSLPKLADLGYNSSKP